MGFPVASLFCTQMKFNQLLTSKEARLRKDRISSFQTHISAIDAWDQSKAVSGGISNDIMTLQRILTSKQSPFNSIKWINTTGVKYSSHREL